MVRAIGVDASRKGSHVGRQGWLIALVFSMITAMAAKRGSPTAGDQVYDALREALRRHGERGTSWAGDAAAPALEVAARAAESALGERLQELDIRELAYWAAGSLAVTNDIRFKATRSTSPTQRVLGQQNFAAARVALELAVRQDIDPDGRAPTKRDLEAVAILAHELWRWRMGADQAACGLIEIHSVRLRRRGTFDVRTADRSPLRWSRFQSAVATRSSDAGSTRGLHDVILTNSVVQAMLSGGAVPAELAEVDEALRADRGYGLVDIINVHEALILRSGNDDEDQAGYVFHSGLADLEAFAADYVTLNELTTPPDAARAAARDLVWTQESLRATPFQVTAFREAPARLESRPVLELSDRSLIVPRTAAGYARVVLLQRVLEGNWPETLGPNDAGLARALERRRQRVRPILGFEAELERMLASLDLPFMVNVGTSPNRPSNVLGVVVRAEIDAVVLVPASATIWVIEAKDLAVPYAPRRVRSELDKYLKPGGHVDKLSAKVADVARSPTTVATCLGAAVAEALTVSGVFVTREPTPAAYVDGLPHHFETIDRLGRLLTGR